MAASVTGAVASKSEVLDRLAQAAAVVRSLGVSRLLLFGSFLHGHVSPESDVDIIVEFESGRKNFTNFMRLAEELESRLQRSVDLVTKESLSPYIGPRILREAQDVALNA